MSDIQYYIKQSALTDPGNYSDFFKNLPDNFTELCSSVQTIILHYGDAQSIGYSIPREKWIETELRYAHKILENKFHSLEKIIGCCRDFSLILCSMLRHRQIPARVRYGFSTYQIPKFHHDQAVVEYWCENKSRWCLVDPRINDIVIKNFKLKIDFDIYDLPRDKFLTAGEAWYLCRNKIKDPNQFGTGILKRSVGLSYIRNKLLKDLASLNKTELLMWDCWGEMLNTEIDFDLCDYIAELTRLPRISFEECRNIYENSSNLKVPNSIFSANPFCGSTWVTL